MRKFSYFLSVISSIMLIFVLVVTSIELVAMNLSFYEKEYTKLGNARSIGMTEKDLLKTTDSLLQYMSGKKGSLSIKVKINGKTQEVFGKREKDHMVDVRNLFVGVLITRNCMAAAVVLLILLIILMNRRETLNIITKAFLWTAAILAVLLAIIAIIAASDFRAFWTTFHHIFFTNDLWILDPKTDVLIQMVPEQFFFDILSEIFTIFITAIIVLLIASIAYRFVRRQRRMRPMGYKGV